MGLGLGCGGSAKEGPEWDNENRHVLWAARGALWGPQMELAQDCPGMDKGHWGSAQRWSSHPHPLREAGDPGASGVSVVPGGELPTSTLGDLNLHKP